MKKVGLTLLSCALLFGAAGCAQKEDKTKETSKKQETIVVATAPDSAPFTYKENGKLTGFDAELIEALAKKEDVKVQWKEMKFNGIVPALQSKQVDAAVAAMTINDERKKVVNFADPYFESGLVLVTKEDSAIKKLEDLKGKTIVAKQGSSGLAKAQELATKYGAKVKILEDEATLYMDVQKGGSDALINDFPFVAAKIKSGTAADLHMVGEKLTGEQYGIAITKDNKELLEEFNKDLKEMKDNGEYKKLYEKYFGTSE
jgi:polar amino acid transport system substrate-binding protein